MYMYVYIVCTIMNYVIISPIESSADIHVHVYVFIYFLAEVKRLNIDTDCLPAGTCILKQIKENNGFKHVHISAIIYVTICWASIQPPFE